MFSGWEFKLGSVRIAHHLWEGLEKGAWTPPVPEFLRAFVAINLD